MRKQQGKSIVKTILMPLCILIVIQIGLLGGTIYFGGVIDKLDQNASDIVNGTIVNRKNYLENEMLKRWSNIDLTVDIVNNKAAELEKATGIDFENIDSEQDIYIPFIDSITKDMISLMRTNSVTGAFVILNNQDLSIDVEKGEYQNKPGVYIRDLEPVSKASSNNSDLLIEIMPYNLSKEQNISRDSGWRPQFEFGKQNVAYYPFLYEPYMQALKNVDLEYSELGYWSKPYTLWKNDVSVISYSVPLILKDKTVYGVLGIELTLDYLSKVLPYSEIIENDNGAYILGIETDDTLSFENILVSGPKYIRNMGDTVYTNLKEIEQGSNGYSTIAEQEKMSQNAMVQYIDLYDSNTPFSNQRWALIGVVKDQDLYGFSRKIRSEVIIVVILALIIGIIGSIIVSVLISRPVISLAGDVRGINPDFSVKLKRTYVKELDELAGAIEELSSDVLESSLKFAQILKMASIKIGGFEVNLIKNSLFITEGFFEVFNVHDVDVKSLSPKEFEIQINKLEHYICEHDESQGIDIYKIVCNKEYIWIKLKYIRKDGIQWIGLAEDITKETLEIRKVEYERDYDSLTELLNRRAFHKKMKKLFTYGKDKLKIAALVMIDLDNLKFLNDTYGHDFGDQYIKYTAEILLRYTPDKTVVARMSGDEFFLFFYGYDTKEEIEKVIKSLRSKIDNETLELPNHQKFQIRMSGGVAWYPENTTDYHLLIKYADFAMYKVKNTFKDQFRDFNIDSYYSEAYLLQGKEELNQLLDKQLVEYHFQPIVNTKTGDVFAYEALLRSKMKSLPTVKEIITLAKQEFKLSQIERLTWFKAMETFVGHIKEKNVHKDCRVFINSLPNQDLTKKDVALFEKMYEDYLHLIVQEITEEEKINGEIQKVKMQRIIHWNAAIAIDDYGSGYNSEGILLSTTPQFIKIDMEIIRDIHKDVDKQKIVENIISYAHERNIEIIAEGVETYEEIEKVVSMGVDYMQGYYYARPGSKIPQIEAEKKQELLTLRKKYLR